MMRTWVFVAAVLVSLSTSLPVVRGAEFKEYRGKPYTLVTDMQSKAEVKQVLRFLAVMHRAYKKVFKATPVQKMGAPKVRVFAVKADFAAFGAKGSSNFNGNWRGYYSRKDNELVSYRGDSLSDLFSILSHEGFHQFAKEYITPNKAELLPNWFEEGLAEYFRSSEMKKGRLAQGKLNYHVRKVKRALKEGWLWTLPQILLCDPAKLKDSGRFDAFYAHAYMFVKFLVEKSRKSLQKVFRLKKEGKGNEELMAEVFPVSQRARLYKAFQAYVAGAK